MGAIGTVNDRSVPDWEVPVREITGDAGVDHVLEAGGNATLGKAITSLSPTGHVMGSDWGKNEPEKPLAEPHTILQWYNHLCEQQKGLMRDKNGLYSIVPDGISSAYSLLAYDLYVLRQHGKLQGEVVRHLRHEDQFQGARYELFVAATFVRAGFDIDYIDYEDETDRTKKHPEFVAKHQASGFVVSVEAKMRHRDVAQLAAAGAGAVRAGVKWSLRNAAAKQILHPLIVFVKLNLPPESYIMDIKFPKYNYFLGHAESSPFLVETLHGS